MILPKQIESESSESVCATIMDLLTHTHTHTHTEQTEAAALEPRFSRGPASHRRACRAANCSRLHLRVAVAPPGRRVY